MASIFKPTRNVTDSKTGKTKRIPYSHWYIKFRDSEGITRKVKGFTDKTATLQKAAELERKSLQAAAGLGDRYEEFRKLPLAEHLEKFSQHLRNKRGTEQHVTQTTNRITKVLTGCRFRIMADLSAPVLADWLSDQQSAGMAAQTANYYATSFKTFLRWMVKSQRMPSTLLDQFSIISRAAVAPDRRLERRSITAEQFQRLIQTTSKSGREFRGLTGPIRSLLYLTCGLTGLRRREAASLTMLSFDLHHDQPTLTLAAKNTKNRKAECLPVHPGLAAALRPWFSDRHLRGIAEDAPLWPGTWNTKAARMLRADLEAAQIPFADDAGRVFDFHALRGQFISELGRSGVPLQTAQKLARHSDPRLTANHYTHLSVSDLAAAVERIQTLSTTTAPEVITLQATGTDNLRGPQWDHGIDSNCVSVITPEHNWLENSGTPTNEETPGLPGFNRDCVQLQAVTALGLEPKTYGLKVRCSTD